jgi:hypothetical protein
MAGRAHFCPGCGVRQERRRPARFIHLALILIAALVGLKTGCIAVNVGTGGSEPAKYKETRAITAPAAAAAAISTRNGSINVRRGDGPETAVTAKIAATTSQRLHDTRVVAEIQPDGALLVTVKWPDDQPRNNESCAFEIILPAATAAVTADTSNGAIDLANLSGLARLRTSNGRITVADHAGSVHASTSNGAVELKEIAGDAEARTSNGAIELREVGGRVTAHTSNGRVTVALRPGSAGPIDVQTTNGSAELTLPPSYCGRFSLSTSNGSVSYPKPPAVQDLQAGRHHANFVMGDGTVASTVTTSNGSIDVRLK